MTRACMNRAVRTTSPVRVTSVTSTTPRPVVVSTRRPARVATMSYVRVSPPPSSTTTSTRSPLTGDSLTDSRSLRTPGLHDARSDRPRHDRHDHPERRHRREVPPVRHDHLEPDEHQDRSQRVREVVEALTGVTEQEVHGAQAEDGERVGREHD